jgi:hypothetical protein
LQQRLAEKQKAGREQQIGYNAPQRCRDRREAGRRGKARGDAEKSRAIKNATPKLAIITGRKKA